MHGGRTVIGLPDFDEGFALSPLQVPLLGAPQPLRIRFVLSTSAGVALADLQAAIDETVEHWEILRLRYGRLRDGPLVQTPEALRWRLVEAAPRATEAAASIPNELLDQAASMRQDDDSVVAVPFRICDGRRYLCFDLPSASADRLTVELFANEMAARLLGQAVQPVIQYPDLVPWMQEVNAELTGTDEHLAPEPVEPGLTGLEYIDAAGRPHTSRCWIGRGDERQAEALAGLAAHFDVGTGDILFAVYAAVLCGFRDSDPLALSELFHGRDWPELDACPGRLARSGPVTIPGGDRRHMSDLLKTVQAARRANLAARRGFLPASPALPDYSFMPIATTPNEVVEVALIIDDAVASGLHLCTDVRADGLQRHWQYRSDRFDADAAAILDERFAALLSRWGRAPAAGRCTAPGAGPVERRCLHRNPGTASPTHFVERFLIHTRENPDTTAICGRERSLTFGQAGRLVAGVAGALEDQGVRAGDRVAVAVHDPIDQTVCMLACFYARTVFVPIDPGWPAARQQFVVQDAAASLTLDAAWLSAHLQEGPLAAPRSRPAADAAYLVYTSGSQGRPKGVLVDHAALAHYLQGIEAAVDLRSVRSMAGLGSAAADLTYTAVLLSLARGTTLHVFAHRELIEPNELIARLARHRPDLIKTVPSLIRTLLAVDEDGSFLSARHLLLGGEALSPDLLDALARIAPRCSVYNHYGPTETTIGVAAGLIGHKRRYCGVGASVIGAPLGLATLEIEDDDDGARGIAGTAQLTIGGPTVACGYWNRPRLTAGQFRPDPGSAVPGGRRYRSGDQARWLHDGTIEFLGRRDEQIKINGFRVEPGEIEVAAHRHPQVVNAAAVVLGGDDGGTATLALFYCGDAGETECRDHLSDMLPAHMMPSGITRVTELPRLVNGKIDRTRLRDTAKHTVSGRFDSDLAKDIAGVYGEVLGHGVGGDDNFFHCGGSSLHAIRAVAALQRELSVDVAVHCIFDHPTANALAGWYAGQTGSERRAPIPVLARTGPMPLAPAQQKLWYASRIYDDHAFSLAFAVEIDATIDAERLRDAFNHVAGRHEILRLRIVDHDGAPGMVFADTPVAFRVVDQPPSETFDDSEARQIARRPFDLRVEAPLRVVLFRRPAHGSMLLLVMHHLATDAWSHEILLREVAHFLDGSAAALPHLPVQYADYAAQRHRNAGSRAGVDAWVDYVGDAPRRLGLPQLIAAGPHGDSAFRIRRRLTRVQLQPFENLLGTLGVTWHAGLLGALALVLSRVCDQDDLVVGTPQSSRSGETQDLIGVFFELLPFRIRLPSHLPVSDFLQAIHRTQARLMALSETPFEASAPRMTPAADKRQPWFNVVFAFRESPPADAMLPAYATGLSRLDPPASQYDLFWGAELDDDGLELTIDCADVRIGRELVEAWVDCLRTALRRVAQSPTAALSQIRLGRDETGPVPAETSTGITLQEIVEALRGRADAVVLTDGRREYRGRTVLARAAGIAAALQGAGCVPGDRIAVALPRDVDLIPAILGIWCAGCVYVPLDLGQPQTRLARIVRAAGPACVIVADDAGVAWQADVRTLTLSQAPAAAPSLPLPLPSHPARPAYIAFTSGSTGHPKGVVIGWRALGRFLADFADTLQLRHGDVVLAATTISFDISLAELILPLSGNATIRIADVDVWQRPEDLAALQDQGVSVMQATPSAWRLAVPHLSAGRLRLAVVGGEAIPVALAQELLDVSDSVCCVYGPTEATVWASVNRLERADTGNGQYRNVPLGRPLAGVQWWNVDRHGWRCPPGIPGELILAGDQLAHGYWHAQKQTATAFVPSPGAGRGGRSYRTGDVVVACGGPTFHFLGRRGGFIKLNGHRIEPGEIEACLRRHAAVAEAAVRIVEEGSPFLAAYVVGNDAAFFEDPQWRTRLQTHLSSHLPPAVMPSAFVPMDSLPRTASAKLDRSRLPVPEVTGAEAPLTNAVERIVLSQFEAVLGRPLPQQNCDFFLVGGNSLTATVLCAELSRLHGFDVALTDVFEYPTVRALARHVTGTSPKQPCVPSLPQDGARPTRAPLTGYQKGIWLGARSSGSAGAYNIGVAIEVTGQLSVPRLKTAFQRLIARHDQLRVSITESGDGYRQSIEEDGAADFQVDSVHASQAHDDFSASVNEPFDPSAAGFCRLRVFDHGDDRHTLVFTLHHAIADEWSWNILLSDLQRLYLDERPIDGTAGATYLEYAHWYDSAAASGWRQSQLEYWRKLLEGHQPLLELPFAKRRPRRRGYAGASVEVRLGTDLSRRLEAVAAHKKLSLFALLTAAYGLVLHSYTNRPDILVGTAVANRRVGRTQNIVGNFANVVPLRLGVPAGQSTDRYLHDVQQCIFGALAHQELPFDELIAAVAGHRSSAFAPLVQNFIVFHNTPKPDRQIEGWTKTPRQRVYRHSEYDLDLGLNRNPDGIDGYLRFNVDLYDTAHMRQVAERFRIVCRTLLQAPTVADVVSRSTREDTDATTQLII